MGAPSRSFPYPIVDHHCHLRPGPAGLEAAQRFAQAGGTHLFLATQNYASRPPTTVEDYRQQFSTTLQIARQVREAAGVAVHCVLAPYPIDLVQTAPELGLERAVEVQLGALRLAAEEVREGRAVALGEVGRAHFAVPPDVSQALGRVLSEVMSTARDVGCPVVLHTEDLDGAGFRGLAALAGTHGLDAGRLVKHYARTYLPAAERAGLAASFLAKRDLARRALSDRGVWFLETDYLDDPTRPGAVLALDTVPRRVAQLLGRAEDPVDEDAFRMPFVDGIRRIYGLELERPHPWTLPPPAAGRGS